MKVESRSELGFRTKQFAIDVLNFVETIRRDCRGDTARHQLVRCSTSVGANYAEACQARSRKEFASKASISLQEAEESKYWLDIMRETGLAPFQESRRLSIECHEIIKMLAASVRTARQRETG